MESCVFVRAEIERIAGANKFERRHMLRNDRILNLARSIDHDLAANSPDDLLYAYIDENLDRPLTLELLSREAGVSSSYLRTWFKAAMGLTVHRYVLRRRVERARFLLLPTWHGGCVASLVAARGIYVEPLSIDRSEFTRRPSVEPAYLQSNLAARFFQASWTDRYICGSQALYRNSIF
jgi:AraC-like DNA-binding protein